MMYSKCVKSEYIGVVKLVNTTAQIHPLAIILIHTAALELGLCKYMATKPRSV